MILIRQPCGNIVDNIHINSLPDTDDNNNLPTTPADNTDLNDTREDAEYQTGKRKSSQVSEDRQYKWDRVCGQTHKNNRNRNR